jgi:hypothetical protein
MSSKRPPSSAALNDFITRPTPVGLSQAELEGRPVVEEETPVPVTAWVRYPETAVQVEGRVIAHTSRAVLVQYTTHGGATHSVWVWGSAVSRR